jgi:hypothetical protein
MASPDFSEYIDLTVNDLQPAELYAVALDYARTALPEFETRVGSVEDALLQAFSLMNSLYIAAANRIPNGTIEGVLRLLGLERREAGVSTVNATFTILTSGGTVEQGTSVAYMTEEDGDTVQYAFFVAETVTATPGSYTVSVSLESIVLGPLPLIPVGTPLTITQPSSELLSCVTSSSPTSVTSAETDDEFLRRGVTYLDSLSNSLCTSTQIESYILSTYPSVTRCKVYDLAYGSSTSPVSTTTTQATLNTVPNPDEIDIVIDCYDEDGQMFLFNDGLNLDIDGESLWVTTPEMMGSATITKDIYPSGLVSTDGGQTITIDLEAKTISIDGLPVAAPATASLGQSMVQLVSGLQFSLLSGTAPALRTPDARGMYVIFAWGTDGMPIPYDEKIAIYDDVSARTPVGIDAFIHTVMPMDIYVEMEVEILNGFVGSSVVSAVQDYLDAYFSPEFYESWSQYVYRNELIVKASEVPGVKRVTSVVMYIPTYGTGDMTSTTGSSYLNNELMGETDPASPTNPQFVEFYYAGTMPKVKSAVTVYGA